MAMFANTRASRPPSAATQSAARPLPTVRSSGLNRAESRPLVPYHHRDVARGLTRDLADPAAGLARDLPRDLADPAAGLAHRSRDARLRGTRRFGQRARLRLGDVGHGYSSARARSVVRESPASHCARSASARQLITAAFAWAPPGPSAPGSAGWIVLDSWSWNSRSSWCRFAGKVLLLLFGRGSAAHAGDITSENITGSTVTWGWSVDENKNHVVCPAARCERSQRL